MNFREWIVDFMGNTKSSNDKDVDTVVGEIKAEIYYKELALYTAITLIANAISKCEIKTYKNNKEVKEQLYYTLNISPNANQNSSQLWHKVIEKMVYDEKALVLDINDKLYCADSFSTDPNPILGDKYNGIRIDTLNLNHTFKSKEVLLLKLDDIHLKKLIDGLYEQYGLLLSYAIKSFKKSNSIKYKLKMSNIKAGDEKFNRLFEEVIKKQLKTFLENDNAVYPEFEGYDLQDISPKNNIKDTSDIRELRKEIFEIVGQTFKIPTSLMLGNITNMNEIVKVFLTFCIDPIADMISEELTRKVFSFEEWQKGYYIKVDTSTINHIDVLDVAEKVDKLIASGTMCIDEVRGILDLAELDSDFSKTHFITKNYDTMENRLKGEEDKLNVSKI
nr:phage portal protein [uncultured Romboutsia sp.]